MVTISCAACQKPITFDENRLPMKEVSFPCPSCKAKVTVDRRTLGSAAPPAPELPVVEDDHLGPKALIVGVDDPMVREAARLLGYQPVHFPAVEACRDFYLQEHPPLVFLNPAQVTRPPLAEMSPMTTIGPADRRKGFFILLADGVKSLDGTVAFLYSVNLVVAYKDLPMIQRIYREAEEAHERLYAGFRAVEAEVA
ncbi:MAG TPA: hypothetical protein VF414_03710 [Thermoanaerobaculia bacterium]